MSTPLLHIDDLHVEPAEPGAAPILRGLDLTVGAGECHIVIGPNGSGKSTLGTTLLGSAAYRVTVGTIHFDGDDVTAWPTDERAKAGMFLGLQHPAEVSGITVGEFLHHALNTRRGGNNSVTETRVTAADWMERLGLHPSFLDRRVNDGFSSGESRRSEIVQMAVLEPTLAFLDDIDSGLDIAGIDAVAHGIAEIRRRNPAMSLVVVATSRRLIDELAPNDVHILVDGRIVATGGVDVVAQLEAHGDDVVGGERLRSMR